MMPAIRHILKFSPLSVSFIFIFAQFRFTEKRADFEELSFAAGDMSFAIHQMKRCVATRLVMMKCYEPCHGKRFSSVEDFFFFCET